MPKEYAYDEMDVFSQKPLYGNPVAIVHEANALNDGQMAQFSNWTNLSETCFLLPPTNPQADYKVRIFTPQNELPFAGHPTLGSCAAWLRHGGKPKDKNIIFQECGLGIIPIRRDGDQLAFAAPALLKSGDVDIHTLKQICASLSLQMTDIIAHQWVDNGPGWCAILLKSREQLLALKPDMAKLGNLSLGVVAPFNEGDNASFEVRAFVPGMGVPEDPVTGSLNAGLAQWLIGERLAARRYQATQGTVLGRNGKVFIEQIDEDIWVGGHICHCVSGMLII